MSDTNKNNRLLCSLTGAEPSILKVFDMNLKDISYNDDHVCESHKPKKLEIKTAFTSKNQTFESRVTDSRNTFDVSSRQDKMSSDKKTETSQQWDDSCSRMDKSLSVAGFSRAKQTLPSSHAMASGKNEEEYPFRPTLSKRSQELAKIRSNLNLTIFENLYCQKSKCNHNHEGSRDKPHHH